MILKSVGVSGDTETKAWIKPLEMENHICVYTLGLIALSEKNSELEDTATENYPKYNRKISRGKWANHQWAVGEYLLAWCVFNWSHRKNGGELFK